MTLSSRGRKNKGMRFQQWVRDKILEYFTFHFNFRAEDVKSTTMGETGPDIQLSPFAKDALPIQIECKHHKSFAIYKVYEQAQEHGDSEPVVFIKADRKKPLAVVDAELMVKLLGNYSSQGKWDE